MRYFLVRSIFGSDNMEETFLKEGRWENGYGESNYSFARSVNSVQEGDVLIMAGRGKMIISIGTCTDNPKDGRHLSVDWYPDFKEFEKEGTSLRGYRSTIQGMHGISFIEEIIAEAENKIKTSETFYLLGKP